MTAFDDWRARSPYYDETHEALAQSIRRFVEREIAPHIDRWEAEGELPRELHKKAAEAGILGLRYPEQYGGHNEGFDNFHGLVMTEELAAVGAGGLGASLMTHGIGLPPILALGSEELKQRVAPPVLAGDKIIALGITEAGGGSDVANLKTTAVRDGDDYIVNGGKMFITSGMRADWLTCAVRTGGPGAAGISLLLIEMDAPGVESTRLDKMGWRCSDTAAIHFSDVRVRQAMCMAINREDMAKFQRKGFAVPTWGILNPGGPGYDPAFKDCEYDPEGAKALLAEAGYPDGFDTRMDWTFGGGSDVNTRGDAEWLQRDFAAVGIRASIEMFDNNTFWDMMTAGMREGTGLTSASWG